MKHKATNDFSETEKEMMDTIAVNYILAQSDGFQKAESRDVENAGCD